jgi:hypothetical protein
LMILSGSWSSGWSWWGGDYAGRRGITIREHAA